MTAIVGLWLRTGWALNCRFDLTFGTAAVLAQGGGGTGPGQRTQLVPTGFEVRQGRVSLTMTLVPCVTGAQHCLPEPWLGGLCEI